MVGGIDAGSVVRLIAEMDWSRTPLGPADTWPERLRAALDLCLSSTTPASVIWGPDRIHLYNDAYAHFAPADSSGRFAGDFMAHWPDWPALADAFERAFAGAPAVAPDRRVFIRDNGRCEERYLSFAFAPVPGDGGGVAGVYHTLTDRTAEIVSTRQLELLRALADGAATDVTVDEACRRLQRALAPAELDVPFALLYLFDERRLAGRLALCTGLAPGTAVTPERVPLDQTDHEAWPLAAVAETRRAIRVEDVERRLGDVSVAPYPEPPRAALVFPLQGPDRAAPLGALVVGLSPRRQLDRAYRLFVETLGSAIAAAISAAGTRGRWPARDGTRPSEAKRFPALAEHTPVMVMVTDAEGRCVRLNASWLGFVGSSAGHDGWAPFLHPDDRERCTEQLAAARERREPFAMECRLRRADGEYRWLLHCGVPTSDAGGCFTGFIASAIDVTERREVEQALEDADRRKDEFLATLAHELRNPLAPIRYSLYLLRLDIEEQSPATRTLDMLDRQVGHMDRLVDDLLEVSRITRGKITLRTERVDVASVLESALEASRAEIEARGHRLVLGIPREPIWLQADPVRLAQVFGNLLHNAAKYTEEGGLIGLEVVKHDTEVSVIVRDSGVGISPEMLPRVFDLFTQGDRTMPRAAGGLGIGLTLVKRLVEMHGGRVEAGSPGPGHGSEFRVTLPLAAGTRPRIATEARIPASRPARFRGVRVVVVDDNRDSADSLGALLASLGAETRVAYDGKAAIEVVESMRPAVVLLDLGMPGMDGFEVARRIRRLPDTGSPLIVAVTGWGHTEARRKSREAGFDHHLVKPVGFDVLQSILATVGHDPAAAAAEPT